MSEGRSKTAGELRGDRLVSTSGLNYSPLLIPVNTNSNGKYLT